MNCPKCDGRLVSHVGGNEVLRVDCLNDCTFADNEHQALLKHFRQIHFWRAALRHWASEWAREMLSLGERLIIIDTETTGLTLQDEVIEIGAIDGTGRVLMGNALIKPTRPISYNAEKVHGITNASVFYCESFEYYYKRLRIACLGNVLVAYNLDFDYRMLQQSARSNNIELDLGFTQANCAMLMYAMWFGEWGEEHQSFRWQKLNDGDHAAVGDCYATLNLLKEMANVNIHETSK